MTAEDRARAVIRIGDSLRGRMFREILDATDNGVERNDMLAGVLGHVLRKSLREIPIPTDRDAWLTEIVKMAVEP